MNSLEVYKRTFPKAQRLVYEVPFLANKLKAFDLWFFTGSRCNLECTHCYVESGPYANKHPFLRFETFKKHLTDALKIGYEKLDIYFTGGEPFINPEIVEMLRESMKYSDTTVLTNGTRITENIAQDLATIQTNSSHKLILRVSLDGPTPELNDVIRGEGTFNLAGKGIKNLVKHGLIPIITTMRSWEKSTDKQIKEQFVDLLVEDIGVPEGKEHLKILPPLRIGREAERSRPYIDKELFTETCFTNYDYTKLQCCKCRMISENGVWVCPILINEDGARMGTTLHETTKSFSMTYMACWTCRMDGMACTNDRLAI